MFKQFKTTLHSFLLTPCILNLLVKIFKATATTGKGGNRCLKEGFLPLPVHFHSPVPDIKDLEERKVWDIRSELKGIAFRENAQLDSLKKLASGFSGECQWPLSPTKDPAEFYLQNQSFSYGCAASTHCVIRHYKPRTIFEIGSGMSSRVISRALTMNRTECGDLSEYIIVDPFPNKPVRNNLVKRTKLIKLMLRRERFFVEYFIFFLFNSALWTKKC